MALTSLKHDGHSSSSIQNYFSYASLFQVVIEFQSIYRERVH